jgi:predicted signal transduction protein with EAL and GGDEF domain
VKGNKIRKEINKWKKTESFIKSLAESVRLLRSFGVDGIQGYYYAKPMPFKNLCTFLKKENAQ